MIAPLLLVLTIVLVTVMLPPDPSELTAVLRPPKSISRATHPEMRSTEEVVVVTLFDPVPLLERELEAPGSPAEFSVSTSSDGWVSLLDMVVLPLNTGDR